MHKCVSNGAGIGLLVLDYSVAHLGLIIYAFRWKDTGTELKIQHSKSKKKVCVFNSHGLKINRTWTKYETSAHWTKERIADAFFFTIFMLNRLLWWCLQCLQVYVRLKFSQDSEKLYKGKEVLNFLSNGELYRPANLKNCKPRGSHKKTWKLHLKPGDVKQVSYIIMKSVF